MVKPRDLFPTAVPKVQEHLAIVYISSELLASMLKQSDDYIAIRATEGIPEGAEIVRVFVKETSPERIGPTEIGLVLRHETFPAHNPGDFIYPHSVRLATLYRSCVTCKTPCRHCDGESEAH